MYIQDKHHVHLAQTSCNLGQTYTFRKNNMYIWDKHHVHLGKTTCAFRKNI